MTCARTVLSLALLLLACREQGSTQTDGSNSNWLLACSSDGDCTTGVACRCGGCTRECDHDDDCSGLVDARCSFAAENARASQCRSAEPNTSFGICLPRCEAGSCSQGQACVAAACVLCALPDSEFCAPVTLADDEQRTRQDHLLELLNEVRAAGGVSCGSDAPSTPAPALRLDARLVCASRVLAADLDVTRARSLLDSQGRGTQQRFAAAGYDSRQWAEGFAIQAGSASDALGVLLADEEVCSGLVAIDTRDVGVARVGDIDVLSLAAE